MKTNNVKISIIIPVLNEQEIIMECIHSIRRNVVSVSYEIIVVDGGSQDNTMEMLSLLNIVPLHSKLCSRAAQMNLGAQNAKGKVLFFLHADTRVPKGFDEQIRRHLVLNYEMGSFRFKFDSTSILLKLNSFFTRYKFIWCKGGDQSMFINKSLFETYGQFDESLVIMEEYPIIKRGILEDKYVIINDYVLGSARKYIMNSYLKVQWTNLIAFRMFNKGASPQVIKAYYKSKLKV